eukprot:CAMPEP_0182868778 /NCGR_PEP_ID=MMETSP0034_2-20130328/9524_1 /TAXON_ID=156128 /ORGANISM="Nephroselmis pyriformis, Strain CCMP717" /LENGTH=222 /DNA_ID=CAMNT_0025001195 /DNA_START=131 /DNA_END=796 /DNA_ORIENTATION=-
MPALFLFGRRWNVATDDFPLPSMAGALYHTAWVAVLSIIWSNSEQSKCGDIRKLHRVVVSLIAVFSSSAMLEAITARESVKGTVFEVTARRRVPMLLYLQAAVFVGTVCANAWGSYVVWSADSECYYDEDNHAQRRVLTSVIISTWLVMLLLLMFVLGVFNIYPKFNEEESWNRRCRLLSYLLCCSGLWNSSGSDSEAPLRRVAAVFSRFFGPIDLVPSDVA